MNQEVIERLTRIETKVDALVYDGSDIETRVRTLERWRWILAGGGGVISALLAWVKH
jgi:hypothetical protein